MYSRKSEKLIHKIIYPSKTILLVNENNDSDEEIVLKRYKFETIDVLY